MGIRLRKTQWFPMGADTPGVFGDTVAVTAEQGACCWPPASGGQGAAQPVQPGCTQPGQQR